jgi:hypothetical protein
MTKYNKLWAVLIGLIVLAVFRYYDWSFMGLDAFVMELAISAATAFGVYQVRNAD